MMSVFQLAGPAQSGAPDNLGGTSTVAGLGDIFGLTQPLSYVPPQEVMLFPVKTASTILCFTFWNNFTKNKPI